MADVEMYQAAQALKNRKIESQRKELEQLEKMNEKLSVANDTLKRVMALLPLSALQGVRDNQVKKADEMKALHKTEKLSEDQKMTYRRIRGDIGTLDRIIRWREEKTLELNVVMNEKITLPTKIEDSSFEWLSRRVERLYENETSKKIHVSSFRFQGEDIDPEDSVGELLHDGDSIEAVWEETSSTSQPVDSLSETAERPEVDAVPSRKSLYCRKTLKLLHSDSEMTTSDEECASVLTPDITGHLVKRGKLVKTWKNRWFVLYGKRLEYYRYPEAIAHSVRAKDPGKFAYLGRFSLEGAEVVTSPPDVKSPKEHCLELRVPGRKLLLCCESSDELDLWAKALKFATRKDKIKVSYNSLAQPLPIAAADGLSYIF